jgi:drug/metabolite transporter (DMT)-like permease
MLSLLTVFNSIFQTYIQALSRDLAKGIFQPILLIALLSWAGLLLAGGLVVTDQFDMPGNPMFYIFWLALTFSTIITFTAFLLGMLNTTFFAASSFGNIGFAITAFFAWVFLAESYSQIQIVAILTALAGSLLFFERKISKNYFKENKGLLLISFSLLLSPLEYIFYKSATLQTATYQEFLTGRLIMDTFFYTLFFVLITVFWYKRNPAPEIRSVVFSYSGAVFIVGSTLAELLGSWLIFKMPVGLFTVLGAISIPAGYLIGKVKYKELAKPRYVLGSVLIASSIILFGLME